jgi:hypothetical protein
MTRTGVARMRNKYKYQILLDLEQMDGLLDEIISMKNLNSINNFIDHYVNINNKINQNSELHHKLSFYNEQLANNLALIVDMYNNNYNFLDKSETFKNIHDIYLLWKTNLIASTKFKIVIIGVNNFTPEIDKVIDNQKAEIVNYIDETNIHVGKELTGRKIISLQDIDNIGYDYLISVIPQSEVVTKLVNSELIETDFFFDYFHYKNLVMTSPEFFIKFSNFKESKKAYNGLITGLSYIQKGVNEKYLEGNFFNFANPSQDIFYDFEIFKYAYSYKEIKDNIKYAIIGLSYYSFQYDLSKSRSKHRINYYYPIVKKFHNYEFINHVSEYHRAADKLTEHLFHSDHLLKVFESQKGQFEKQIEETNNLMYNCQKENDEEILKDIQFIRRDFNKDYPETVKENKKILTKYLEFIKQHSIKPIIVICPTTKLYQSFAPKRFKEEFYEIIDELKNNYDFQILDYFNSNEFEDNDFYDPSHINNKGAKKLSLLLNKDINW